METTVIRWTPDSKKLIVAALREGATLDGLLKMTLNPAITAAKNDPVNDQGLTVSVLKSSSAETTDPIATRAEKDRFLLELNSADLTLLDVEMGKVQRLAKGLPIFSWRVSPDGANVAVVSTKGFEGQGKAELRVWELRVVSLADGRNTVVVPGIKGELPQVNWSPDGNYLAYLGYNSQNRTDCFVVSAMGGESRNLTQREHPSFWRSISAGPLWSEKGETIFLLTADAVWKADVAKGTASEFGKVAQRNLRDIVSRRDGSVWRDEGTNSALLVTLDNETNQGGLYRIDLDSGVSSRIVEGDESYGFPAVSLFDVSSDGRQLTYVVQSADRSKDIWTLSDSLDKPKQVTHVTPLFERYVLGTSTRISWRTLQGQTVYGALLLPAGYQKGKRYPLILYQYPGSTWSDRGNIFGFNTFTSPAENWQFFATRGYAVLFPDIPAKPGTYMKDIADAVLPALDKVVEMGIADPNRIGVGGQSNGGYGVLSLLVQTDRFKAALSFAGSGNLISSYTLLDDAGQSPFINNILIKTGSSLWEERESFIRNSPIFFLDRVKTPLLLVHGSADQQVEMARSAEIFTSLRFLGKEVEYAKYAGESHGVSEWSHANQVDYLSRNIAWFDKHLKAPEKKPETAKSR